MGDTDSTALIQFNRHVVGYLLGRLTPAITSVAGTILFTRILGVEQFGLYALAVTITFMVAEVASQWLQQAALRFFPARTDAIEKDAMNRAYVASLAASAIVAALATVAISVAATALVPGLDRLIAVAVALCVATLLFNAVRTRYPASLAPARYALYSALSTVLRLVVPLALLLLGTRSASMALLGVAIGYALFIPPIARDVGLRRAPSMSVAERQWIGRWLAYGGPMIGWFVSLQVLASGDRFIVAAFAGASAVGIYAAVYDLVNRTIAFLANALELAVQPLAMRSADLDEHSVVRLLVRSSIRYLFVGTVPVVVVCLVSSKPIFSVLLPPGFIGGYAVAVWIAIGVLLWHFTIMLQKLLEAASRTRAVFLAAGVAAVANVVLNLLLVPTLGFMGAGMVTAISYGIQALLVAALCRDVLIEVMPWRSLLRIVAAGTTMAAVLLIGAGQHGILAFLAFGTLSLAVYGAALFALGEFSRRSLSAFRSTLSWRPSRP